MFAADLGCELVIDMEVRYAAQNVLAYWTKVEAYAVLFYARQEAK